MGDRLGIQVAVDIFLFLNDVRASLETACYIFLSFGKIGQIPVAKRAQICILGGKVAIWGSTF